MMPGPYRRARNSSREQGTFLPFNTEAGNRDSTRRRLLAPNFVTTFSSSSSFCAARRIDSLDLPRGLSRSIVQSQTDEDLL